MVSVIPLNFGWFKSLRRWVETSNFTPISQNVRDAEYNERVPWFKLEAEVSGLSGMFLAEGYAVDVAIYRRSSSGWRIATYDAVNLPLFWSGEYKRAEDAWSCFIAAVEKDGMPSISGDFQNRSR